MFADQRNYSYPITIYMLVFSMLIAAGCQTAYYGAMESLGYHKRQLLVDRVEDARESQEEAKEQFRSALDTFSEVVGFEGGSLQKKYESLNSELEDSEARAKEVRDRIDSVENVAEALFDEWEDELGQYSDEKLRRASREKLDETRVSYQKLISAMKRAEKKMKPVLSVFRDQVLFLKHNLNAQAIASLQGELVSVETNVEALIRDMEESIKEADIFLSNMQGQPQS